MWTVFSFSLSLCLTFVDHVSRKTYQSESFYFNRFYRLFYTVAFIIIHFTYYMRSSSSRSSLFELHQSIVYFLPSFFIFDRSSNNNVMICWTTESEALLASSPPSILLQQPLGRMLLDTGSVSNGIPETLRQLPETVRQVLNGCVGSVRTPERGGHITIYVTSADASGKSIFIRHQFVIRI